MGVPLAPIQWHMFSGLTFREQLEKEKEWAINRLAQVEPYKDVPPLAQWLDKEMEACKDLISYCDRVLAELPTGSPAELIRSWLNEFSGKERCEE